MSGGRAGEKGVAISLVAPSEAHRAQAIEQLQKAPLNWETLDTLTSQGGAPLLPAMSTLVIGAGRKDKVRPGDILGALTGEAGIPGAQVGKIAIFDFQAFVAVDPKTDPASLPLWRLGQTIGQLQAAGSNVERLQTAWHMKVAYGFSLAVMSLLALALIFVIIGFGVLGLSFGQATGSICRSPPPRPGSTSISAAMARPAMRFVAR